MCTIFSQINTILTFKKFNFINKAQDRLFRLLDWLSHLHSGFYFYTLTTRFLRTHTHTLSLLKKKKKVIFETF